MIILLFLVLSCFPLFISTASKCSLYDSCQACFSGYPTCIWCATSGAGSCVSYYGNQYEICNNGLKCPKEVTVNEYSGLADIISKLKLNNIKSSSSQEALQSSYTSTAETSASSSELKDLLHKLLLLKLLRKVKSEGSASLSDEDRKLLAEYSSSLISTTTTTTTTTPIPNNEDVNIELTKLLALLKSETDQKAKSVLSNYINPTTLKRLIKTTQKSLSTQKTVESANSVNTTESVRVNNRIESGRVNYEEEQELNNFKPLLHHNKNISSVSKTLTVPAVVTYSSTSLKKSSPVLPTVGENYCSLYEKTDLCNSDNNCTWCNTKENCIARHNEEYHDCVNKKRLDEKFGLDQCLAFKGCKACVDDTRCYWCGTTKSCHSYPFFGYIPDTCASGFYVKQCDVQLAVIIIVLPLIIILLAMITFYFCLKYCYYRRKVLRVPLFEKPGVFDYRKDKKVYFVNPEDEDDSEDEMQVEKFRKQYRLPADKTPLIDPNS